MCCITFELVCIDAIVLAPPQPLLLARDGVVDSWFFFKVSTSDNQVSGFVILLVSCIRFSGSVSKDLLV